MCIKEGVLCSTYKFINSYLNTGHVSVKFQTQMSKGGHIRQASIGLHEHPLCFNSSGEMAGGPVMDWFLYNLKDLGLVLHLCTSRGAPVQRFQVHSLMPSEIVLFHICGNESLQALLAYCCRGHLSSNMLACRLRQQM